MKTIMFMGVLALLCACASTADSDRDEEPRDRTSGIQITAGPGSESVVCPYRGSDCYYNVVRACGDLGVVESDVFGGSTVATAGRSGSVDDPFARVEATRNPSSKPVRLRCGEPLEKPGN